MSLFDEKENNINIVNEIVVKIKNNLNTNILPTNNWNIKECMENYAIEILKEMDFNSCNQKIENNLEYIEWYYNTILYIGWKYLSLPNRELFFFFFNNDGTFIYNKKLLKGLFNIINNFCKENNLEFITIDEHKYKLISINLNALVSKIDNKKLHHQITKFWLEKELEEKVKILGWISGHIENRIKDQIDYSIFHQDIITKLFKDLNNLYKHFDKKDQIPKHMIPYEKYQCLSEKEKLNKANKDMRLIMYILLEYENN